MTTMIKSHLLLAEYNGCVVTTSHRQTSLPGHRSHELPDIHKGEDPAATSEGDGLWSCSGVILDRRAGIVICQAAVFFPFLKEQDRRRSLSDQTAVLSSRDFPPDLMIQVECPYEPKLEERSHSRHPVLDQRSGLDLVPVSKSQGQRMQCQAELVMLLPCPEFHTAFSRLFRKEDGWVFSSEDEKEYGEFQKDLAYLHWFAVLKLRGPLTHTKGKIGIMDSAGLVKGSTVFTCGSPFGSFYPDIFLNTVSKGILSNTAGEGNVVLLTDARCLPGSEGSGVFVLENGRMNLIGIVVTPLCWKANEWVGLTVACSISHIINNLIKALSKAENYGKCELSALDIDRRIVVTPERAVAPIQHLVEVAVLVDSGPSWGSGVLVKPNLVLTCRHVVGQSSKVSVKIQKDKRTSGDRHALTR